MVNRRKSQSGVKNNFIQDELFVNTSSYLTYQINKVGNFIFHTPLTFFPVLSLNQSKFSEIYG